jgi:hypothetical protein
MQEKSQEIREKRERGYMYSLIYRIRVTELQKHARMILSQDIRPRDEWLHGGAPKLDVQAVQYCKEHDSRKMYDETCIGFEHYYGISVAEYYQHFVTAPRQIIETFNRRADLKELEIYQMLQDTMLKDRLVTLCDQIINSWRQSHSTPEKFPSPEVHEWLEELDQGIALA